jgi:hypothetical protein
MHFGEINIGRSVGMGSPCPLATVATHKAASTLLLCVPKPRAQESSHRVRNLRADWYSFIYEEDVRLALHGLEVWYKEEHVSWNLNPVKISQEISL